MLTYLKPVVDFASADTGLIRDNLAENVRNLSASVTIVGGIIVIDSLVEDIAEVAEAITEALDNV